MSFVTETEEEEDVPLTPGQQFVLDLVGRITGSVPWCGCVKCHSSLPAHRLEEHNCDDPRLIDFLADELRRRRQQKGLER